MVAKVLIRRTSTPNLAPEALEPGELAVEMADPAKLWVGVPTELHPEGRKLLTSAGVNVFIAEIPPENPTHGFVWYESDTGILWMYYVDVDSGQWVQLNGIGGGAVARLNADIQALQERIAALELAAKQIIPPSR